MTDYKSIYDFALANGCEATFNEPLKKHTSFKIGGNAALFVVPQTDDALSAILKKCSDENIRTVIIGNGSNLLVGDKGISGLVLEIGKEAEEITVEGNRLRVSAGAMLSKAANVAASNNLGGMEFAAGIPGSLGGAVVMNAGAYGGEICRGCTRVEVMDLTGQIRIMSNEEMQFSYRHSLLEDTGDIVIRADFCLTKGDPEQIKALISSIFECECECAID